MKPVTFPKVGFDLLVIQIIWSLWALGVFGLIQVVQKFFFASDDSFYNSGYIASNIYMLVIGIIAISFLTYFVEHGVTRKNYFYGNVIASAGLSILIPITLYIIGLIEKFFVHRFTHLTLDNQTLDQALTEVVTDVDGNIIAETVLSLILAPYINPETNLFLALALFSLNIFVFYIIGWMISSAFKRLGVIGGILIILVGLAFVAVKDSMIRLMMDIPLFVNFSFLDIVPEPLALPVVFLVIVVTLIIIRLLTKRVAIDI